MLQTVEIFSTRASYPFGFGGGGGAVLPLGPSIDTDPIQIVKIDGLGPVEAVINTAKIGNLDGDVYLGSNVSKRNIVMTLRLNLNDDYQDYESIRNLLYSQFMPKTKVRLKFVSTHLPDVDITGYIESVTPELFSKDPEYQVSIICPNPAFADLAETSITSVTDYVGDYTIFYDGTVDCGLQIDIHRGAYAGPSPTDNELIIFHTHPLVELFVIKHLAITIDQMLSIVTVPGQKSAKITRPGVSSINVLQKITTSSIWPILTPGDNVFDFSGVGNLQVDFTFRRLYGGL